MVLNKESSEHRDKIQLELFHDEKILVCLKVYDDKKLQPPSSSVPNPLQKLRQHHKPSISANISVDEKSNMNTSAALTSNLNLAISTTKDSAKAQSDVKRIRFVVLTSKKLKNRLHKVKPVSGSYQVSKTWGLDELKSIENIDPFQFVLYLNKQYIFQTDEPKEKIEFLYVLLKLCSKSLRKQPKLINISETGLQDELTTYQNRERLAPELDEDNPEANFENQRKILSPLEEAFLKVQYEQEELNVFEVLTGYDWNVGTDAAALEERLLNELTALEAANVHAIIQADDQSQLIIDHISDSVVELDKVGEWLSLYSTELLSMGKDISNIESQNKGLQIQTNNQKALLSELQKLLESLTFSEDMISILTHEPLEEIHNIKRLEGACTALQATVHKKVEEPYQMLAAVSERTAILGKYVSLFSSRLTETISLKISKESERAIAADSLKNTTFSSANLPTYEYVEDEILPYRNLIGWLKESEPRKHNELQIFFVQTVGKAFRKDSKDFFDIIRSSPYRRSNDEVDYLFVQYSKLSFFINNMLSPSGGNSGLKSVSMASMLGHRKALSTDTRNSGVSSPFEESGKKKNKFNDSVSQLFDATGDEKILPDEALKKFLSQFTSLCVRLQNFLVDFFHLSGCKPPGCKISVIMADLPKPRDLPKDLRATKKIEDLMFTITDGLLNEILPWMENVVKVDLTFILGFMVILEVEKKTSVSSKVPFLVTFYNSFQEKLQQAMDKFMDEQIRAIEETKVNLKGKIRVVSFIRVFPSFVRRMESFIKPFMEVPDLECRKYMNGVYERITKIIFDMLDKIASEAESASEDKEQMNAHILSLENMHHLYMELRGQKVSFLDTQIKHAKSKYDSNLNSYIKAVVRKPLGKLIDFFDGIEDLLKTKSPEEVSFHFNYNKNALKKILHAYPGKDVKKGIEGLKKKVEKNFAEEEGLLQVVWHGIQEEFIRLHRLFDSLITKCYPEVDAKLGFSVEDLCVYFSDIAKMRQ